MSTISEHVKELRKYCVELDKYGGNFNNQISHAIHNAISIKESLSAKLQAENMDRSEDCRSCGSGCLYWDSMHGGCKIHNTVPGGCKDFCPVQKLNGSVDCGGWIPCKERLPEDGIDVLVWFEYFRYGEYNRLFQSTGISYMYNGKWSGFVNGQSGWNQLSIIAWQPLPEPYHEP